MVIDIIDYTEEQFAAMAPAKISRIQAAQVKKNKLLRKLEEDIEGVRKKLVNNGTHASIILQKKREALTARCNTEIEEIRLALLFYLRYASGANDGEEEKIPSGVPYKVDFSLSEEERMEEVKAYYMGAYANSYLRLDKYAADEFAKSYLGETYAPLYHYFESLLPE